MSTVEEYTALLHKARAALPEDLSSGDRWTLPPAEIIKEGRFTLLRNFRDLLSAVRREEDHLAKFLLQQLATAGQIDGDRLVFTGNVTDQQVMARLDDYVATFVQCSECGSPDTKLDKNDRVQVLQCEACGAHHPVKARKGVRKAAAGGGVRDGAILEVTIDRVGNKGQGMATVDNYTVVVPSQKMGNKLTVRITRIAGNMAVGTPV
jgi:translation initiation factor 2 subunit 2